MNYRYREQARSHRFCVLSAQLAAKVEFNELTDFLRIKPRTQQPMQLAECRFTGHAAPGQHTDTAQATACLIDVQFNPAFVALRHRDHYHAVILRTPEAGEKFRVVTRP